MMSKLQEKLNQFIGKTIKRMDLYKGEDHVTIEFTDGSILGMALMNDRIFDELKELREIKVRLDIAREVFSK